MGCGDSSEAEPSTLTTTLVEPEETPNPSIAAAPAAAEVTEATSLVSEPAAESVAEPAAAEAEAAVDAPSEEDIALCSKPSIPQPQAKDLAELLRLLAVFGNYANVRYPAKPEVVLVDKVVMAVRGCSSVVKKRQDDAVAAGVVPLLVAVLTGCHLADRETCLRTSQCISGVANKNADACAAFRDAGAVAALEAVIATHSKRATKDMEAALATVRDTE